MTRVPPLAMGAIDDPELRTLIAVGEKLGVPGFDVWENYCRAPEQRKPLLRALLVSHTQGNIDHKLKEGSCEFSSPALR